MLLMYPSDMPHLYAGIDTKGRPWVTVRLPKAFGEHLKTRTDKQRLQIIKGLLAEVQGSA